MGEIVIPAKFNAHKIYKKMMFLNPYRNFGSAGFRNWATNGDFENEFISNLSSYTSNLTFSKTTNSFGSLSGAGKWFGGVLAPNGKIYGIPFNNTKILEIDPTTNTTTLFGSFSGSFKWLGGVLAPNGKIYGIPLNSNQVLEIDPATNTTTLFGSFSGGVKWVCGVLAPNGKIYGIPYNSTQILEIGESQSINENMVLSRYLNKF